MFRGKKYQEAVKAYDKYNQYDPGCSINGGGGGDTDTLIVNNVSNNSVETTSDKIYED